MQTCCAVCGYALSPFDKTCPRCAANKNLPVPATALEPIAPVALPVHTPDSRQPRPKNFCTRCGQPRAEGVAFCSGCGHSLSDSPQLETASPPAPHVPPMQEGLIAETVYHNPASITPPHYQPFPHQNVRVVVNNSAGSGSAGWIAALMVALFATPLGCIALPLALVAGGFFFGVVKEFMPILIAIAICSVVYRSTMNSRDKQTAIIIALVVGAIINAIWWTQFTSGSSGAV